MEKYFRVDPFLLGRPNGNFYYFLRLCRMVFFIFSHARDAKAILTWFGDYHSAVLVFLGKILRIPVIIFAGGQEAICYPELHKGVYLKPFRGRLVKYALRNCAIIVPNHESLIFHNNLYYNPAGKKDGIQYYIPDLKTKVEVIPNGIDLEKYYRITEIEKDRNFVLTVGTMDSIPDFINKGFDLFIELAKRNPRLTFTLIGIQENVLPWAEQEYHLSKIPNLTVIPSFCPDEVLFENYNRAKVFIQASITEGMPNTLNEAMLCGCVPVGSDVNGIPDAIGETGVIVKRRSVEELEQGMLKALTMNTELEAIRHAQENFSLEQREKKLISLLLQNVVKREP